MGIGTLRRYHDDSRAVGLTPTPEGSEDAAAEQEHLEDLTLEAQREAAEQAGAVREFEAKLELREALAALHEAQAALTGPAGDRDLSELISGVTEAATAAQEAEAAVADAIAADEADREEVAAKAKAAADAEAEREAQEAAKADEAAKAESTKHGDLERPTAQGSTAAWIAYAKSDPNGSPVADLTERKGLRDEIAQAYLGK